MEAQQPLCIDCYNNKFANTCQKCGKRIQMADKDILYDNHHWHDTCLRCVVCEETLSGRSFLTRSNDEFVCIDCHRKTDPRRCKICDEGFEPGTKRYLPISKNCFLLSLVVSKVKGSFDSQTNNSKIAWKCQIKGKKCEALKILLPHVNTKAGLSFLV